MFAAVAVSSDGISKVGLSICFFLAHRKWFGHTDLVFIRSVKLLIVSGFRLRSLRRRLCRPRGDTVFISGSHPFLSFCPPVVTGTQRHLV